jgi:3-oxoacyl-[acyl-carrier protein] reductase
MAACGPAAATSRRVVVTGAGGGIGRAAAVRLASRGALVALLDIRAEELHAAGEEARQFGGDVLEMVCDVAAEADVEQAAGAVHAAWGGFDAAAAGISMSVTGDARVDRRLDLRTWELILRTNLTGIFLTCKHAVRLMEASGGGSIVVIGSPSGLYGSAFGEHAYSAAKGGVHALAPVMAGELAPLGIRVNVVVPGFIDTRMNAHVLAEPALMSEAEALIPMRRVGKPAEVAGIIEWLTSDDASYATGGYFTIDGGQTCL